MERLAGCFVSHERAARFRRSGCRRRSPVVSSSWRARTRFRCLLMLSRRPDGEAAEPSQAETNRTTSRARTPHLPVRHAACHECWLPRRVCDPRTPFFFSLSFPPFLSSRVFRQTRSARPSRVFGPSRRPAITPEVLYQRESDNAIVAWQLDVGEISGKSVL